MRVRFLKAAYSELREAARYYEIQSLGLGADFVLEIMAAVDRIAEFPVAWQKVDDELRRCRVGRFPYGLIYTLLGDDLLIVAVSHLRQRPRSWRDRLRGDTD